jgi:DNA-binding GntR family transcriptional regulator
MIDPDLPVPLWEQLVSILRAKVESRDLTGRVPSIKSLSQDYGVSTRTAERALSTLRDEGVLVALHGKGYYIAPSHRPK